MRRKQEWLTFLVFLRRFVNNRAVLKAAQIKHPNTPISTARDEGIDRAGTKADVEDFLVMRDELRFRGQGRYIPDRASSIDAAGYDELGGDFVPVETGQRGRVLRRL